MSRRDDQMYTRKARNFPTAVNKVTCRENINAVKTRNKLRFSVSNLEHMQKDTKCRRKR